jgi:hypothetical protein
MVLRAYVEEFVEMLVSYVRGDEARGRGEAPHAPENDHAPAERESVRIAPTGVLRLDP